MTRLLLPFLLISCCNIWAIAPELCVWWLSSQHEPDRDTNPMSESDTDRSCPYNGDDIRGIYLGLEDLMAKGYCDSACSMADRYIRECPNVPEFHTCKCRALNYCADTSEEGRYKMQMAKETWNHMKNKTAGRFPANAKFAGCGLFVRYLELHLLAEACSMVTEILDSTGFDCDTIYCHRIDSLIQESFGQHVSKCKCDQTVIDSLCKLCVQGPLAPLPPTDSIETVTVYNGAISLIEDGKYEQAIGSLEDVVKSQFNIPDAVYALFYSYINTDQIEKAKTLLSDKCHVWQGSAYSVILDKFFQFYKLECAN